VWLLRRVRIHVSCWRPKQNIDLRLLPVFLLARSLLGCWLRVTLGYVLLFSRIPWAMNHRFITNNVSSHLYMKIYTHSFACLKRNVRRRVKECDGKISNVKCEQFFTCLLFYTLLFLYQTTHL
jgi:hypothetical protein